MALWMCTRRKFQLDQLLCDHVLAVVRNNAYEAYDFCYPYYSREFWYEFYNGVVHLVPHINSWSILERISSFKLSPPDVQTSAGRQKKRRIPSLGEELPQPKCSRCK